MGKTFLLWLLFFSITFGAYSHAVDLSVLPEFLRQAGFETAIDGDLFEKVSAEGITSISVPEDRLVVVVGAPGVGGHNLAHLRNLQKSYGSYLQAQLDAGEYDAFLKDFENWLTLSHFSNLKEALIFPMLKFIYPTVVSLKFPDEKRQALVAVLKKHLPKLAKDYYRKVQINEFKQEVTFKASPLLLAWLQIAVFESLNDSGFNQVDFLDKMTLYGRQVEEDMSGLVCEVGEQGRFVCRLDIIDLEIDSQKRQATLYADETKARLILPEIQFPN